MKIYLYITCLAFVALLFLAPSTCAYTNSEKGFSISPPESWSTEEDIEGVVVAFIGPVDPDVGYVNINVDVQNTLQSLSTIVENTKQSWSSTFSDYSLLADKSLTVNGMSCHELEISYTDDGASCMQDSVLFVADDLLYQVTYFAGPTTYSNYLDVWAQSLNSFEIASWQSTNSSDGFSFHFEIEGLAFVLLLIIILLVVVVVVVVLVRRSRKPSVSMAPPPPPSQQ